MTEIIEYYPALSPENVEDAWAWDSPSPYWRVTKVQPVHRTGRQAISGFRMLLIEFSHVTKASNRIVVEAYVTNREDLSRLGSFLDAAVELPPGIRIRAHTVENAPWDHVTPRGQALLK